MGLYLAFEGIDGSGKSKQLNLLSNYLKQQNFSVLTTSELGSCHDALCSAMRELILSDKYQSNELTYQMLLAANSFQHSEKVLKPLLNEYDFILSDRSIISNLVYGFCSELEDSLINMLFYLDRTRILPHLVVYLDIDPNVASARRQKRTPETFNNNGKDRIESKNLEFQINLRQQYLSLLQSKNYDYLTIDAALSIEQAHYSIIDRLKNFLKTSNLHGHLLDFDNNLKLVQRINKWLE